MTATRHTISGQIDPNTPQHVIDHPVLGQYLEVVPEGTKPYAADLFTPGTVDERKALVAGASTTGDKAPSVSDAAPVKIDEKTAPTNKDDN